MCHLPSFKLRLILLRHYDGCTGAWWDHNNPFQADAPSGRSTVEFEWILCAIFVRFHHFPCVDIKYAVRSGHYRVQDNVKPSYSSLQVPGSVVGSKLRENNASKTPFSHVFHYDFVHRDSFCHMTN